MSTRDAQILLWILHTEDSEMKHIPAVTRLDIMDGATLDPHPEGLWSTTIFGAFGNEQRDILFGKIDLKVRILHPKIYSDLMSLRQLYKNVLNGTQRAVFIKSLGDYVAVDDSDPKGDTGFAFFMSNLPFMRFKKTQSVERNTKIDAITRWSKRLTMKNFPVLPAGLRDIEFNNGQVSKNEINDYYYRMLSSSMVVAQSDDMESPAYDGIRRSIQNVVNELYEYLERITGGKRGYMRDKFLSRRIMDSTRNVITAMDASGAHLDSVNVPGFDSTVLGLYQASRMYAPIMMNWLRQGPLGRLYTVADNTVPLINPTTLETEWVEVEPKELDSYISTDGMMRLIALQESVASRHTPIKISDHYLALVYQDKSSFKVFYGMTEVPDELLASVKKGDANIHPITLEELLYYAGYNKFGKKYNTSTRYPTTDDNSIYPTRPYVKTTTTSLSVRERAEDWQYYESDDNIAPEWPMSGIYTYHDSHSPHSGRLGHSQADFDGDMKNSIGLMSQNATEELIAYNNSRNGWVTPDGQMRCTINYDTSIMIFKNLTTRYNHVTDISKQDKQLLLGHVPRN